MSQEQIKAMMSGVENLWACFDDLIDGMSASDWDMPHGPDWKLSSVPYHMAYTDRILVAEAIRRGQNVPAEEAKVQRTLGELNDWNNEMFAQRPKGQTGPQAVQEWRAGRQAVREAIMSLQDEDLMTRIVFFRLTGCGWVPAMVSVGFALAHTWSEFIQLRFHLGGKEPEPAPLATHGAVGFLINFLPALMDRDAAKGKKLTVIMRFAGDGGGDWTVRVADGQGSVVEESAADSDLVISQTPETFELIRQGKLNPMEAMGSGAMLVEGMEHMPTFGAIFAPPPLDKDMPPMGGG